MNNGLEEKSKKGYEMMWLHDMRECASLLLSFVLVLLDSCPKIHWLFAEIFGH